MSDIISSDLSASEKDSWATDPRVYAAMNSMFNFSLDAAASELNHKHELYLTKEDDALTVDWKDYIQTHTGQTEFASVWINPPYSRGMIKRFIDKAISQSEQGLSSVLLVPCTPEASWLPIDKITELKIVTKGRLSFVNPRTGVPISGNTKGSMFVIIRPNHNTPMSTSYIERDKLLAIGETILNPKQ